MGALDSIIKLLQKPFPEPESRMAYFKIAIIFSLFVTFFLFVFQPFGISDLASQKFIACLGFGSMTLLGIIAYEFTVGLLLKKLGIREHWTYAKWILNNIGLILYISLFNFLFARLFFFGFIQWDLFPIMLYSTFMIGTIPLLVYGAISLIKQETKYQHIASEINQHKPFPVASSPSTGKSIFGIPSQHIKYIQALQNYIKIGYINSSGSIQEQVERATMKALIEEAEGTSIMRCHRSYMVNKEAIVSISGNAQGLLLSLSACEKVIPVSRSRVHLFR